MASKTFPLVGSLTSRDATNTGLYGGATQKDQFFLDASFQIVRNDIMNKTSVWVSGRNDFDVSAVPSGASGNGTAIRYWRGHSSPSTAHILTAYGSTNSTIYDGNTSLGAITGICLFISETKINDVATAVFVSNGNRAYYFTEGGALTEITDLDFPPKQTPALTLTGNFVHMDGLPFIMTTNGQIWHGKFNTLADWESSANISAQESPDPGVGVARYRNYIYALSRNSGEFFQNTGNASGAVLSRVQGAAHSVGCISERAIVQFADTVAWVGGAESPGVYILDAFKPVKISTPELDTYLEGVAYNQVRLNVVTDWAAVRIAISITDSGAGVKNQYVYYPELKTWQPWNLVNAMTQSDCPGTAASGCFYVGPDQTKYLVNSDSVRSATVQFGPIDMDTTDEKAWTRFRLIADKASQACTVSVSWSDNDGKDWSTPRSMNMESDVPTIWRCGQSSRRMWRITGIGEAANDRRLRIEAAQIDYKVRGGR